MIQVLFKGQNIVTAISYVEDLNESDNLVWIDLINPTLNDISQIEKKFDLNIPSRLQQEEIESSSRYIETDDYIVVNSNYLFINSSNESQIAHVSFVIKNKLLVTYREQELPSFTECIRKIRNIPKLYPDGRLIFLGLFETRVDIDADLIEKTSNEISEISKLITVHNHTDKSVLYKITSIQELTMKMRENIIDKQRAISSILKSEEYNGDEKERIRIILRDITSLVEHTDFLFERLDYLQETFLGLVNIDQNKIIKIFTIISVVFMPPTLIASIYGMNFKILPELEWTHGYAFSLGLMAFSSLITLSFFRMRKWI